ncbi:MAG: hypothetical protein L3J32_00020 [Rhizobiaceae bacterium]|nr:hypothetical protein [Rhizobiaceae bacterium]
MNRFRYSRRKFWNAFIVALALTAMVTGLTWMILTRIGNPRAFEFTAAAGLIFLAFFSARMALLYFRDEVVLAILPTGIDDARWGVGVVQWERIKEITLHQRESEFELIIHLWPVNGVSERLPIDLDTLESDVDIIVHAIEGYLGVRSEY